MLISQYAFVFTELDAVITLPNFHKEAVALLTVPAVIAPSIVTLNTLFEFLCASIKDIVPEPERVWVLLILNDTTPPEPEFEPVLLTNKPTDVPEVLACAAPTWTLDCGEELAADANDAKPVFNVNIAEVPKAKIIVDPVSFIPIVPSEPAGFTIWIYLTAEPTEVLLWIKLKSEDLCAALSDGACPCITTTDCVDDTRFVGFEIP